MAEEEKLAREEDDLSEEGEAASGKKNNKLLIIIIVAILLIGGAGAGAFFLMGSGDDGEEPHAQVAVAPITPSAFFYEMPEILVNLASSGTATRYLKLKVNLEVGSEADLANVELLMPRVVDDFQLYLRQLRVEDLNGSAGIYRLKEDLLMRANQSAAPVRIENVLFKEVLIQ